MLKLSKEEMQEAADYTKAMHILFSAGVVGNFTQAMKKVKEFEDAETALKFANMSYTMAEMGIGSMEVQQEFMKELVKPLPKALDEELIKKAIDIIYLAAEIKGVKKVVQYSDMKNPIVITVHDEPVRVAAGRMHTEDMWGRIQGNLARKVVEIYGENATWSPHSVNIFLSEATENSLEFGLAFDVLLIGE